MAAVMVGLLVGCSSAAKGASPATTVAGSAAQADTFALRYCEVILVRKSSSGLVGTVYNSYPLNSCPQSKWAQLDAKSLASANAAVAAGLNGPRYWLMDHISKQRSGAEVIATFGGISMIEEATVALGSLSSQAYTPHAVDRNTVFTFDAGRTVYELVDPSGRRWVMQTWSQIVDPTLGLSDLAGIGSRLHLPAGWKYQVRRLDAPLQVVTTTTNAQVLQDDLQDSYSLETS